MLNIYRIKAKLCIAVISELATIMSGKELHSHRMCRPAVPGLVLHRDIRANTTPHDVKTVSQALIAMSIPELVTFQIVCFWFSSFTSNELP